MSVEAEASTTEHEDTHEVLFGAYGADWLAEQLPGVLASDPFMQRFLRIFQDVADTVRWPADNTHHYWQAAVAPIDVVQWLGMVLGVQVEAKWSEQRQREFVQMAGPLLRTRGTLQGLGQQLARITGGRVAYGDSGGVRVCREPHDLPVWDTRMGPRRLTIRVETTGHHSEKRFDELVAELVPADCIYKIYVGPITASTRSTVVQ